ncbi:hypothetical protein HPB50_008651 [Hyalomma asiaticum]|uniref:Uncharacterized protein n=1 Tax=Hyalomma asiaticum TaxID=266040 RepID=A0ACB7TKS5_HYAAI|nr:hypothetical protein HPB50_008651 [Hyalomma asiaticum]
MSAQAFSPPVPTSTPGEPSGSRVSVVIEDGVIKSRVEGALIPDVNFESFFTDVWREHEDQIALVDARCNTTYTFGELLNTSRRVAAGLRKLGLRAGDVVAFHGANSSELLVAMCGTFFAGGIGVLNKKSLNQVEIHYQLDDAKPKFVFCDSQEIEKMGQACKDITSVQPTIAGLYPTVIRQLDQWENIDDFDTRSLTKIIYGGAPVNAYIRESVRQKLRLKEIIQGDKGYYTADGCIFLCGRFKELIKCMDQQVYPAELEELLAADPEVRHVVVAGIPHAQYGEAARAFVVHWRSLTDPLEQQREAERLKQVVAIRLAYHKHLHGGLEFLDAIPESEYGKGARKLLAKAYVDRCHSSKASGSPMTSENQ